jgi:ElaB/YqjD/DUF883 family membrane-anchored ribosome-binding protein
MICPKCGLDQEERLDCKECGIVFSKYNALFSSSESQNSTGEETPTNSAFQELQLQVRELSSQRIDIEFEKAERKKIRMDQKNLEERILKSRQQTEDRIQKLEAGLKSSGTETEEQFLKSRQQMEDRLRKLEDNLQYFGTVMEEQFLKNQQQMETSIRQLEGSLQNSGAETETKISPEILEILGKSVEMEQKTAKMTDNLNRTINQLTSLWEKTGQNSFQITELHDQLVALRNDFLEMKSRVEALHKAQTNDEPKTIVEDDVKAIRRNLDELGQFISSLGRRQ